MTLRLCEVRESLPDDFENLLVDSVDNGHQFLLKLQAEWLSGANRFSKPGERLLAATEQDWLIGVGGITIDPYLNDAAKGRIRHVYVHSRFRRKGIVAAILKDLEKDAVHHFDALTLRTNNPEANLSNVPHAILSKGVPDFIPLQHRQRPEIPEFTHQGIETVES